MMVRQACHSWRSGGQSLGWDSCTRGRVQCGVLIQHSEFAKRRGYASSSWCQYTCSIDSPSSPAGFHAPFLATQTSAYDQKQCQKQCGSSVEAVWKQCQKQCGSNESACGRCGKSNISQVWPDQDLHLRNVQHQLLPSPCSRLQQQPLQGQCRLRQRHDCCYRCLWRVTNLNFM
jgi:hypothetical protein